MTAYLQLFPSGFLWAINKLLVHLIATTDHAVSNAVQYIDSYCALSVSTLRPSLKTN